MEWSVCGSGRLEGFYCTSVSGPVCPCARHHALVVWILMEDWVTSRRLQGHECLNSVNQVQVGCWDRTVNYNSQNIVHKVGVNSLCQVQCG